jgi:hypothetical protein
MRTPITMLDVNFAAVCRERDPEAPIVRRFLAWCGSKAWLPVKPQLWET